MVVLRGQRILAAAFYLVRGPCVQTPPNAAAGPSELRMPTAGNPLVARGKAVFSAGAECERAPRAPSPRSGHRAAHLSRLAHQRLQPQLSQLGVRNGAVLSPASRAIVAADHHVKVGPSEADALGHTRG